MYEHQFQKNLNEALDLKVRKQALAKTVLPSYEAFSMFKSMSTIIDEMPIKITKNQIEITTLDLSRISLIHFTFTNDSYECFSVDMLYLNLAEFSKLLQYEVKDNSITEIIFGKFDLIYNNRFNFFYEVAN
ncbi:MAG: hypothetical protein ACTSWE_03450 [Promethearchaeota archaeon]